jgi:Mg/Co/Ni transporter MgtE
MQEVPTLRLVTLRRLLAKEEPPAVLEPTATVDSLDTRFAVVVDDGNVRGTLSRDDAWFAPDGARADAVMSTRFVALEPEDDADTALEALRVHDADRVVVISRRGELLGVLTSADMQ